MSSYNKLGVTCCYFNPFGYKTKFVNFLLFYESLLNQVDNIQVVELVNNFNKFQLPSAIKSLKVQSGSILWHKENLLNLGIDILISEGYENIAWLDSDVVFPEKYWAEEVISVLDNSKLCQLFSNSESYFSGDQIIKRKGCVNYWLNSGNILPINESYSMGYGWATKSEILHQCPLYDKSIIGGGDSLIWLASFDGLFDIDMITKHHPVKIFSSESHFLNFLYWSKEWGSLINGDISCLPQSALSLNHGSFKNRNYSNRYKYLRESNFDPYTDLHYNDLGVLESSNKKMNKKITNYFYNRNEDDESWFRRFFKN
jgi:hypothetical protein